MPSAETFNQVVRRLQEFANGHYILNGAFYFGQLEEADADKISQYPYMHVQPTSVTKSRGINRFDFDIYFMDRPKRTEDQYDQMRDGLSDTLQISHDLVAMIEQGQLFGSRVETSLANGITAQPLMKETKHSLDGWLLQLGIIVPASLNACDVPGDFEFITSGSSSGGGLGNYMLKSVYDSDNDGCVDCADEIDGIDGAGNSKYYGTNGAGVAGFHALPSASIADGDKGDIIVAGSGEEWSIQDGAVDTDKLAHRAVTNDILEHMAQNTIKGNDLVLGDPKDLTANEASTILDTATDPFVRTSDANFDPSGSAAAALATANAYTDSEVSAAVTAANAYTDTEIGGLNLNGLREGEYHNAAGGDTIALSTTSYMYVSGATADTGTETLRQNVAMRKLTTVKLSCYIRTTQSATGGLRITLRVNGVDTALVLNIAASSVLGVYSTTGVVTILEGNLIGYKVQNLATATSAAIVDIGLSFNYAS